MSIELCLIVRNSGNKIINTLLSWKSIIGHWTILDTGSTDGTQERIKNTLKDIPGQLFEEPNSNFKFDCFGDLHIQKKIIEKFGELPFDFEKARNRSLDLCKRCCDFIITIDDTYIIKNPLLLKQKLTKAVDKNFNAFLIDIENNQIENNRIKKETTIQSLRIIRSKCNYRWVNSIHELLDVGNEPMINISLDKDTYIYDEVDNYHNKRSTERHKQDIYVLSICYDNATELHLKARYAYYAAQTSIILNDEQLIELWLKRRINLKTLVNQDLYCALNQYARFTNDRQYAEQAIEMFPLMLEAYYEAAQIAYNKALYTVAYSYLRHGLFMMNHNIIMFHSVYFEFLKLLIRLALRNGHNKDTINYIHMALKYSTTDDYVNKTIDICKSLGFWEDIKNTNLSNQDIVSNQTIQDTSNRSIDPESKYQSITLNTNKLKRIVFITGSVITGPWDGSSTNVRGSETSLIKLANKLALKQNAQQELIYEVRVFCETPYKDSKIIDGVTYTHLNFLIDYLNTTVIDYMICSRSIQYLKLMNKYTKTIRNHYVWFHDAGVGNDALCPSKMAFRKFIFLTKFHHQSFVDQFGLPTQLCNIIPNGVDVDWIRQQEWPSKVRHNFIYSSDPNRGLYELLEMFPLIRERWPDATLDLYCDLDNTDAICFSGDYKKQCDSQLIVIKSIIKKSPYITVHGRVSKQLLYEGFSKAEFWFYPNTFVETFCITALEAQYFKCKILCSALGALPEVVKSGIVYDVKLDHKHVLDMLFSKKTIWKLDEGYQWALKHSYNHIVEKWIEMFKECS